MARLNKILETRIFGLACLLISVTCRIVNILYVSFIARDKIIVMQQSRNFLEGRGLSQTKYFFQNLDAPVYDFTPYWPPGYPILLSPFLKIFNYNIYWSSTAVDLVFAIAFIFIVRKIVKELGFPPIAINISTLIAGCFDYSFIYKSLPTDTPAFVIFLFGLLLFLRICKKESFGLFDLTIASILVFLPCTFRYSFPPLSIAVSIAIILLGWYLKKPNLLKRGVQSFAIISVLIVSFFLYMKTSTGSAGFIVDTGRGFFPANLLKWEPFIVESFINVDFTTIQLKNKMGVSYVDAMKMLELVNGILLVSIIGVFVFLFFKKKFFASPDPFNVFVWVGFFISAATCISLAYLSLTYRPQLNWGNYLDESRYFMFANLFLQIVFIGWIFLTSEWKKNLFQKIIIFAFSLLLSTEILHNIYFHTKVLLFPEKYSVAPLELTDYSYFIKLMNSIDKDNPGTDIVVACDHDDVFPMITNFMGHKGVYNGYSMLNGLPSVKKETILLLPLYDIQLQAFGDFLSSNKAQLIKSINGVNFYRINLLPDKDDR